jgi:putative membrane protein
MIIGIVFWALIVYAIFRLIPNLTNRSLGVSRKEETALEILKRRYASGEIDAEEFTRRKRGLES